MTDAPFDFGFFERFSIPLKRFQSGETIFSEGDDGDRMYVVLEGKIDIATNGSVLETVGLHGIFGEMALIDRGPRSASATANAPTELAIITEPSFVELVRKNPVFSLFVMRQMAARIRRMNKVV
jgi:CRP/FNR family transcriptional regulator, cyclic AMP receptor protein